MASSDKHTAAIDRLNDSVPRTRNDAETRAWHYYYILRANNFAELSCREVAELLYDEPQAVAVQLMLCLATEDRPVQASMLAIACSFEMVKRG